MTPPLELRSLTRSARVANQLSCRYRTRPPRRSNDRATARTRSSVSRIRIITQPEGASVTINGVGYGTTPLDVPYLPPGAKRIRVTKAGYESEERFFSSDVGRASSLRITLREMRSVARSSTR